jgi:hypothetical protein
MHPIEPSIPFNGSDHPPFSDRKLQLTNDAI